MKRLIVFALLTASQFAFATGSNIDAARKLLDAYYGRSSSLVEARELLQKAIVAHPDNAEVYVQAARLRVMSGHVVSNEFRGNTVQVYQALLDKALALDPRNAKAYILKAEAYDIEDQLDAQQQALDKARDLGTQDPWLWNGYGRYYTRRGQESEATAAYRKVIDRGPGETASERKAYTVALMQSAWGLHFFQKQGDVMQYATLIRRHRHPDNAWVMGDLATLFNLYSRFDDAIDFAREALRTMNYGVARASLATALYGKAAKLILQDQQAKAAMLIEEAGTLGVDPGRVLSGFALQGPEIEELRPVLQKIVR
jgi:tetratricopeptide (TPR) repeat protein